MRNKLQKELNRLWSGELVSVLIFWVWYFLATKEHTLQIIYPLVVLSLILIQGSIYWLICLRRLNKKADCCEKAGSYFKILKYFDAFLLLAYIPILVILPPISFTRYLISLGIALFCVLEYINYYFYRLSYKQVFTPFSQLKTRTLVKSRLAKEIDDSGD